MPACIRVRPAALEAAARAALERGGVPADIARVEAEVMVEADRCGVPSHGVLMLPRLLAGLRDKRANPAPAVRIVREHGATCIIDGDNGPGRFVAVEAMARAVANARAHGIGACLAIRTTHWGRAHAYAARAAREGTIGLCTTNAIPTMRLPGVPTAALGNNPIAIGVPRGAGRDPIVLDLAMTQAALGKVATHAREGRAIPPDWGADLNGVPTADPAAILASGLLLPMGGHKGAGLAIMMELLTAALGGGLFGHEIAAADATGLDPRATKLFVAIDVGAFGNRASYEARVEELVAYLGDVDPAGGTRPPGERGWRTRDDYDREGIPIHPAVVAQLAAAGVNLSDDKPA
jgi:LDH2 family malate/lactate/ureidoglycolate dehydrogenase